MAFAFQNLLVVAALFLGMVASQELGRRLGQHHRRVVPNGTGLSGAAEAAIFGLLGLFLAFTFSTVGTRFDARRHMVVDEANAIGTAWLRIDLLPADHQAPIRELFRQYLDARLEMYRDATDAAAISAAKAKVSALQAEIWRGAVAGAEVSGRVPPFTVLLPALNTMFDVAAARSAATLMHVPVMVFVIIGVLSLIAAVFAGYDMAGGQPRGPLHRVGFAAVLAVTIYIIIDLDYPRLGLIRVETIDQILVDVRASMK